MKKTILLSIITAVLVVGCVDDKYYGTSYDPVAATPYAIDWNAAADSATKLILIDKHFIFEDYQPRPRANDWGYFNLLSDKTNSENNTYWPQAHALDVVIDAYLRTGDSYYKDIMEIWFDRVPKYQYGNGTRANSLYNPNGSYYGRYYGITEGPDNDPNNGGGWWNPFIDDMEWIVLTQIRMYQATGVQEYLDTARLIYDNWIITTWDVDENFGGVLWSFHPEGGYQAAKSKNACSNGPAAIIAARLYNITKEEKYLEQAEMIYAWERWMLYNPETGGVNDNVSFGRVGTYKTTYNQGTFLGAAHELYNITGKRSYLEEAHKAAEFTMTELSNAKGILASAHTNDLGLFNGIFVRYFTLLANDEKVDKDLRRKYGDFIRNQAIMLWTTGINRDDSEYGMLFTGNFETPGFGTSLLGYNTTAATIIEAVNVLKPIK